MGRIKDKQKTSLLVVFAIGVLLTYVSFLFLPAMQTRVAKDRAYMDTKRDSPRIGGDYSMGASMDAVEHELRMKKDEAFDEAFLENMISHHEKAISIAKLALEKSKDADILALSLEIIKQEEKEILLMNERLSKMR